VVLKIGAGASLNGGVGQSGNRILDDKIVTIPNNLAGYAQNIEGITLHELGHLIGFLHSHCHYNRKYYVEYKEDVHETTLKAIGGACNAALGQDVCIRRHKWQYKLATERNDGLVSSDWDPPYDYDSVMHYSFTAPYFTPKMLVMAHGEEAPRVRPSMGSHARAGTMNELSVTDKETVNKAYKCIAATVRFEVCNTVIQIHSAMQNYEVERRARRASLYAHDRHFTINGVNIPLQKGAQNGEIALYSDILKADEARLLPVVVAPLVLAPVGARVVPAAPVCPHGKQEFRTTARIPCSTFCPTSRRKDLGAKDFVAVDGAQLQATPRYRFTFDKTIWTVDNVELLIRDIDGASCCISCCGVALEGCSVYTAASCAWPVAAEDLPDLR